MTKVPEPVTVVASVDGGPEKTLGTVVDLGRVSPGSHQVTLTATGHSVSSCEAKPGTLGNWRGTLSLTTN